jgi:hypothetical protein
MGSLGYYETGNTEIYTAPAIVTIEATEGCNFITCT